VPVTMLPSLLTSPYAAHLLGFTSVHVACTLPSLGSAGIHFHMLPACYAGIDLQTLRR